MTPTEHHQPDGFQDALTGEGIEHDDPDLLVVTVSRPTGFARQQFYVRRDNLVRVLHPDVPLGEVFERLQ